MWFLGPLVPWDSCQVIDVLSHFLLTSSSSITWDFLSILERHLISLVTCHKFGVDLKKWEVTCDYSSDIGKDSTANNWSTFLWISYSFTATTIWWREQACDSKSLRKWILESPINAASLGSVVDRNLIPKRRPDLCVSADESWISFPFRFRIAQQN